MAQVFESTFLILCCKPPKQWSRTSRSLRTPLEEEFATTFYKPANVGRKASGGKGTNSSSKSENFRVTSRCSRDNDISHKMEGNPDLPKRNSINILLMERHPAPPDLGSIVKPNNANKNYHINRLAGFLPSTVATFTTNIFSSESTSVGRAPRYKSLHGISRR